MTEHCLLGAAGRQRDGARAALPGGELLFIESVGLVFKGDG